MFFVALLVFSILAIYEFTPLYNQKLWRDFGVNAVLWLSSFILTVFLTFEIEVPSPATPIQIIIELLLGK